MMKTRIILLVIFSCIASKATSQSRGIQYGFQNFASVDPDNLPNWAYNKSSTYVIGNEDVIIVSPVVEQNGNYYTLLNRYDKKLCYKGNSKITIPNSAAGYVDIFLEGTSKSDGGFALVSNSYPYLVRNYNNQGVLLFSKRISCPMNTSYFSGGAKIIAHPNTGNLFVLFEDLDPVAVFDPLVNVYGSPMIKVIEISPTGNLVNAFQIKIPYDTIYPYKNTNIYNIFDFPAGNLIADAAFVKGSPSMIAQDRIWVALNLDYARSYELDPATQQVIGPINNNYLVHTSYPAIAVITPQGNNCTTDIVKTDENSSNARLAISKDAISTFGAEVTLLSVENKQPVFYRFNNHLSSVVNQKFQLPYAFGSSGLDNPIGDIKRQDNTLVFSLGKHFGTFDINNTLNVDLRIQNSGNNPSSVPGRINFVKGNTSKLHINMNYLNANNSNKPFHFMIKEDLASFASTCRSFASSNFNANLPVIAESINLINTFQPLTGVQLTHETYSPIKAGDLILQNSDMCLTCQTYTGRHNLETNVSEGSFILYPNPATHSFEISGEWPIEKVEVFSMLGQLVKTYEKQERYAVVEMAKGSYIVKITTAEGLFNKTLIIE